MSFLVLLALGALVFLVQRRSARWVLEQLVMDHTPSAHLVEPGEELELVLTFQNTSWAFLPFLRYREKIPAGVEVHLSEEHVAQSLHGQCAVIGTTWLFPRQKLEKKCPISIPKRGCYAFSDLQVNGGDFLGLKETVGHFDSLREVVVYPARAERTDISRVFGGFLGEVSVRRFIQEDPVLTLGFREYTGREPMKMISWAQSARRGELMVKNCDYTLEPSVTVLLNIQTGQDHTEEAVEACYSLTRSVCDWLEATGVKYDFYFNAQTRGALQASGYFGEGLGRAHYWAIMEQLGRGTYFPRILCDTMFTEAEGRLEDGRGVIFITPGDIPGPEEGARRMALRKDAHLLILTPEGVRVC